MSIILQDVVVDYGNHLGIDHLSMNIERGELVSILGPSGSGKTSTLNAIAGLIQISGGQILFDNRNVAKKSPQHRNIGVVFQNYALYPHLDIAQNIAFPLYQSKTLKKEIKRHNLQRHLELRRQKLFGHPQPFATQEQKNALQPVIESKKKYRQEIRQRVEEIAHKVGVADQLKKRPQELSGGQQQRVAIARAVIKNPEVLLLDEPFSHLDVQTRTRTRDWIRAFQREAGVTTIFVTHDQEEALSISDKVFIINQGKLQQSGTPREIYQRPANRFVATFIGTPPMNFFSGEIDNFGAILFHGFHLGVCQDSRWFNQRVTLGIRAQDIQWKNVDSLVQEVNYPFRTQLQAIEQWGHWDYLKTEFRGEKFCLINEHEGKSLDLPFLDFAFPQGKVYVFALQEGEPLIEVV